MKVVPFERSFASHPKSIFWNYDKNNSIKPENVFKGSITKKYWFDCNICNHSFCKFLNSINNVGSWCPYCANQTLCNENNCSICNSKSFISNEKSYFWNYEKNGDMKPRDVFNFSRKKAWFKCIECNLDFETKIYSVSSGTWCPNCRHKTERKAFNRISELYKSIIIQYRAEWCKRKIKLPYDLCIPELKIIIELDGQQHFQQVRNWNSPEDNFNNDIFKQKCANENGFSIIRIIQKDVWNDKYDWLNKIIEAIEKIKKDCIVQNIYLCQNNEYYKFYL